MAKRSRVVKKQAALEWLIEQINQDYPEMTWAYKEECEQAKQMERQQIIDAYNQGVTDEYGDTIDFSKDTSAEEYYNETYGNES
jgi:hypothetical protein